MTVTDGMILHRIVGGLNFHN